MHWKFNAFTLENVSGGMKCLNIYLRVCERKVVTFGTRLTDLSALLRLA